jgi:hypothetical protein
VIFRSNAALGPGRALGGAVDVNLRGVFTTVEPTLFLNNTVRAVRCEFAIINPNVLQQDSVSQVDGAQPAGGAVHFDGLQTSRLLAADFDSNTVLVRVLASPLYS